jgi:hypothetical protein
MLNSKKFITFFIVHMQEIELKLPHTTDITFAVLFRVFSLIGKREKIYWICYLMVNFLLLSVLIFFLFNNSKINSNEMQMPMFPKTVKLNLRNLLSCCLSLCEVKCPIAYFFAFAFMMQIRSFMLILSHK